MRLWAKKFSKWKSSNVLERARSFKIKYKLWAQHSWVSTSPFTMVLLEFLSITRKISWLLKTNIHNSPNQDYAFHIQSMKKVIYRPKSLTENWFKLYFFHMLSWQVDSVKGMLIWCCIYRTDMFLLLLTYKLVKYSQDIANKSFINIYVESWCSIAI